MNPLDPMVHSGRAARASSVLSAIGLAGMIAAIGYGVADVRRLGREHAAKADSLRALREQAGALRKEVDHIRSGPLRSLLKGRALAVPAQKVACTPDYVGRGRDAQGLCNGYGFLLWLDLPYSRRFEIRRVTYRFAGHTTTPERITTEASNGFLVGWLGWWPWPSVPVTVETTDGERFSFDLPMERLVRDAGWKEGR